MRGPDGGHRSPRAILGIIALVSTLLVVLGGVAQAAPSPVTFAAKTDFSVGSTPRSVAARDLNGDARLDLVVANSGASSVSVLLGDGTGAFGPKTDFGTGLHPGSLMVADLNGDARLDLVVANSGASSVSVLLGDGTGAFGPKTDFVTPASPQAAAMGDVNGDAVLDLVTGAELSVNGLSLRLGDGAGGFGASTSFGPGTNPVSVAMGDLNGDAHLDLAVANGEAAATVSVLLGDGTGGFGPKADFATGTLPLAVAMGDLNRDTRLDLAVANHVGSVSVLLGDGAGGFGPRTDFATASGPSGSGSTSVAVGDLNNDTFPDLAVANADAFGGDEDGQVFWSLGVSVLVGDGTGGFGPHADLITGSIPTSVVMGDVNGDSRPDIAVANSGSNSASVLLNSSVTAPGAPAIGSATAGNEQASVSWTAPVIDGGSPITGYVVTPYVGYFPLAPQTFGSTTTTQTVTGLANGTTYRFRVRALNTVGTGLYSKVTNPVTPTAPTVPAAPTIGAAVTGDAVASVSWTAPASDGGSPITGYVVTPYIGYYPLPAQPFDSTVTTQTVTGLSNGTTYRFRVQAVNALGVSGFSKVTTPITPSA